MVFGIQLILCDLLLRLAWTTRAYSTPYLVVGLGVGEHDGVGLLSAEGVLRGVAGALDGAGQTGQNLILQLGRSWKR